MTATPSPSQAAVCLIYHGRVQGVGFRYTTRNISRQFEITGFVRNLTDGTVELVAQGQPGEIDHFLDAVRTHFDSQITLEQCAPAVPDLKRDRFVIRR